MKPITFLLFTLVCFISSLVTISEATTTINWRGLIQPRIPIDPRSRMCWDPIRKAKCVPAINDFFNNDTKTLSAECCEAVRQVEQNPKCAKLVLDYPFAYNFADRIHHYCALTERNYRVSRDKYWWRTDRPVPKIDAESIKCWDPIRHAKCMFKINAFFYMANKTLSFECCEAVRQVGKDSRCVEKVFVEPFSQDFANEVHDYCVMSTQSFDLSPSPSV